MADPEQDIPETARRAGARRSARTAAISSTADLADYLGLSLWTVSRAINGHPEVKASTRQRVLLAMDKVGFQPNPMARGLNGKSTGLVGICFGNPRNPLMGDKIASLVEFLRERRVRAVLAITPRDESSERRIIGDFRHMRVDGVILVQSYLGVAQAKELLEGLHCVHVDPPQPDLTPFVAVDRHRAMHLLVDHLVGLGHRSFASLGFSADNAWRWKGLTAALWSHGIDPKRNLQAFQLDAPGRESFAEGIELARRALAAKSRRTAWLAVNDHVAIGAIQHLRDAGFSVPEDFSVTGFDNLEAGRFLRPALTTIDQRADELMRRAGELLFETTGNPRNPTLPGGVNVEPQLLARESTGPARPFRK